MTVPARLTAHSRATKLKSWQSRPGEVKYVPGSGYKEFSPGIQSRPEPGLAGQGRADTPGLAQTSAIYHVNNAQISQRGNITPSAILLLYLFFEQFPVTFNKKYIFLQA